MEHRDLVASCPRQDGRAVLGRRDAWVKMESLLDSAETSVTPG